MAAPYPFDAIKSAREELAGLNDVLRILIQREHVCEEAMAAAEQELNAIRKIVGYTKITIDLIRQRIAELEASRN